MPLTNCERDGNWNDPLKLPLDASDTLTQELAILTRTSHAADCNQVAQPNNQAVAELPAVTIAQSDEPTDTAARAATDSASGALPSDSYLGSLENTTSSFLDIGVASGALVAAEALGALLLRSPKLAALAVETAEAGTITRMGSLALGSTALAATALGGATVARHYGYEALTGESESWNNSYRHASFGTINFVLARKLTGFILPKL